jgi:hypothetical protein
MPHVTIYILVIKIQMVTMGNCTLVACATLLEYTNGLMKYESIPYIVHIHTISCNYISCATCFMQLWGLTIARVVNN